MKKFTLLLGSLFLVTGCTVFSKLNIPMEKYKVTVCASTEASGVEFNCTVLGTKKLPSGPLVASVAEMVAPLLAEKEFKGCQFTTYPELVSKVVTVTATASCVKDKVTVQQNIKVIFEPVS